MLQNFLEGRTKIFSGGNMETKLRVETEGMAIQKLPHLGIQPPNPNNNPDAKKYMLTGV